MCFASSRLHVHSRTGNFLLGGGVVKPFAQTFSGASCPDFYEAVEKKRGSYDALA